MANRTSGFEGRYDRVRKEWCANSLTHGLMLTANSGNGIPDVSLTMPQDSAIGAVQRCPTRERAVLLVTDLVPLSIGFAPKVRFETKPA